MPKRSSNSKANNRPVSDDEQENRSTDANPANVDQCSIFTAILDRFPYYLYVSDPITHEILYVSSIYRNILKTGIHGHKCYEVFQGLSEPCEFCTNELILKTRKPHVWEYHNRFLGRYFLVTDQIIRWPDGRDVRFETAMDITDQKKLEKMVAASEDKYKSLIEHSSYGFFIMNSNFQITYLNKKAEEIYGSKLNSSAKPHMSDIISPGEQATAIRNLKIISEKGPMERPGIYTMIRADGQVRKVEIQTFPIWKDDSISGYHGTVTDITERMEHERKLRENSEFLDAVVRNSSEGIFVLDDDMNYALINPASGRILGHDPEKWIGKRAGSFKHPDDEKKALESIMKVMSEGSSEIEIRVKSSDGIYHLLYIRYTLMTLNDKEHILGIVTDITESRKSEDALRESEVRYRSLFNQAAEGIIFMPVGSERLIVNESFAKMHGYGSPEEMEHLRWEDLDVPESAKLAPDRLKRLMAGEQLTFEVEHYHKDGHVFPLLVSCKIINVGGVQHYMGSHQDITERKEIQKAMRESERKYRTLFEFSPEAIILVGQDQNVVECNNAALRLFGRTRDQLINKPMSEFCSMDETEREYFAGVHESIMHGSRVEKLECEMTSSGGSTLWIEVFPTLIITEENSPAVQFMCRDITERKVKEEEVKKKFLRFNLESGNIYIAREARASASLTAFKDLVIFGLSGVMISRARRKDFMDKLDMAYTHIRISEAGLPDTLRANQDELFQLFSHFSRRQVVLIDCMDYIVSRLGEKRALNLVQDISDIAWKKKLIVIICFDPKSVSEATMNLFAKDMHDMVPCESLVKLSDKHMDILEFIAKANAAEDFPTYSQIGDGLDLSKPTVRTRIKELKEMGIISEKAHGRTKRLELTEKGTIYMT